MKRTLLFALSLLAVVACSKFDDSAIWNELNKHEDRIVKLETLCNQMNTNIASLQTIIIALQSNDYVVNIAPIKEGNKEIGYTITFSKSGSITIYHGKDGENGKDGVNGADGKDGQDGANGTDGKDGADGEDGYTPKIGVKQHTDGKYYWTLDGNWLLDDSGNMIPTTGEDGQDGVNGADGKDGVNGTNGKDGQDGKDGEDGQDGANGIDGKDGKDGITPQLKIEDGYWYLSYDNGATWQKLGKATGNNGLDGANGADGEDGNSIIQSITQDDDYVYFNLTDGQIITLIKRNTATIVFKDLAVEALCVRNWDENHDGELSYSEAESISSLKNVFTGNLAIISFEELKYFTGLREIGQNAFKGCSNLWRIQLPENIEVIQSGAFNKCSSLEIVKFTGSQLRKIEGSDTIPWSSGDHDNKNIEYNGAFAYCYSLRRIHLPESVEAIGNCAFAFCSSLEHVGLAENSRLAVIEGTFIDGTEAATMSAKVAGAFMYCSSLREFHIPDGLTQIGPAAFYKCVSLNKVHISDNSCLVSIGGGLYEPFNQKQYPGAFAFCTSLKTFTIPSNIKIIYNAAFYGCTSLSEIKVTSIDVPILHCISSTYERGEGEYIAQSYHFKDNHTNRTIYVSTGCLDKYKTAEGWSNYASCIEEYIGE